MIHLRVTSGRSAGRELVTRKFPLTIGREASAGFRVEDDGTWDSHAVIQFSPKGYHLTSRPEAPVLVDGVSSKSTRLRNGQSLRFGGAVVQFWLANVGQRWLGLWQTACWALVLTACLAQILLVYLLVN